MIPVVCSTSLVHFRWSGDWICKGQSLQSGNSRAGKKNARNGGHVQLFHLSGKRADCCVPLRTFCLCAVCETSQSVSHVSKANHQENQRLHVTWPDFRLQRARLDNRPARVFWSVLSTLRGGELQRVRLQHVCQ